MRCPKCRYISFGAATKCRNCGYDFSLSQEAPPIDLPIQGGNEPLGPLGDLPLSATPQVPDRQVGPALDAKEEPGPAARASVSRLDLPLFATDDAPLVSPAAVPRPPLSVRRGAPALAKPRPDSAPLHDEPALRLDDEPVARRAPGPEIRHRRAPEPAPEQQPPVATIVRAPTFRRLVAGAIDLLILGGINAAVVYFTLRVLGHPFDQAWTLPKIPLGAFLLLLNGGYFVLFTAAGGQTIGKMATGIRVVMQSENDQRMVRVGFGTAVVRAAAYLASALPAGVGFAPIVFSSDGRTVHDRLADTRVVRA